MVMFGKGVTIICPRKKLIILNISDLHAKSSTQVTMI
jgi:hypothetical protein